VIVEVDENGDELKRPALDWSDYFHRNPQSETNSSAQSEGMTRGEMVVSEFWVSYLNFNLKFLSNI
jgi:hypothetical protein